MDPDPDADPAIFIIDLPKMPTKNLLQKIFFLLITSWRYLNIIFKDKKKSKRSHKAEGINVFLTFLLGERRIQSRIHTSDWWIRIQIQEAQKHVDPVDPDPQHWLNQSVNQQ